ncbi:MAG: DUF6660 family protein [Allomuricauda sp.]
MKFLTIILTIYFLALNVVPCSDSGNASDDCQTVSVVDFDGDHGDDCELCSPFCQCHCCHVHTIHFGIAKFELLRATIPQDNFAHFDSIGKDITFSLFQPPQV